MTVNGKRRTEIRSHGVRLLLQNHKNVRELKKEHAPWNHGHKVWPTSWLVIDYLKNARLKGEKRILDLACGWGLSGIFCAKAFNSEVTWIDGDEAVYPYLNLLAEKNKVTGTFMHMDIDDVGRGILENTDIVIASDICFSDDLVDSLRRFINRAKRTGVSQVLISDPGRWTFHDLAEKYAKKKGAELIDWEVTKPVKLEGKILALNL